MELMACSGWGVMQKFKNCFISIILSYNIRKKTAFIRCTANQAGTGHKLHFQPKNPARAKLATCNNKKAVAQLRCDADISEVLHTIDTIIQDPENDSFDPLYLSRATAIFVVDCCQFGPSWMFGLKMELMACANLAVGTKDQSCHLPDLVL